MPALWLLSIRMREGLNACCFIITVRNHRFWLHRGRHYIRYVVHFYEVDNEKADFRRTGPGFACHFDSHFWLAVAAKILSLAAAIAIPQKCWESQTQSRLEP
jgi:hypothetical protein